MYHSLTHSFSPSRSILFCVFFFLYARYVSSNNKKHTYTPINHSYIIITMTSKTRSSSLITFSILLNISSEEEKKDGSQGRHNTFFLHLCHAHATIGKKKRGEQGPIFFSLFHFFTFFFSVSRACFSFFCVLYNTVSPPLAHIYINCMFLTLR